MLELDDQHNAVLGDYSRAVVHLRKQVLAGRFGLIFGAGLSRGFQIPTWASLVEELAKDDEVLGMKLLNAVPPHTGLPYKTEMLFEHYKQYRYSKVSSVEHHTRKLDFQISADWRDIIRKHLYTKVKAKLSDSLEGHPYMKQYVPLIQRSHMTVTYNFDDFIEQSLLHMRPDTEPRSLGFESVTNPWTQFRRTTAIIYHPNGVIPQNPLESPSDEFVFSEASYAEQLMGIFAGNHAGLVNHLSKHTCLLIGLSLDDETLRNMLMQGARSCPGNFHYYVCYLEPGKPLCAEQRQAIRLTNFKVYNLITLFLDDAGIRSLAELIDVSACPSEQFCDYACENGILVQFRYYVTGALGVGKSTTINFFRNLTVLDEWLEQRISVLAKDWETLTTAEQQMVDEWLLKQFRLKNNILRNDKEGIFLMDRGPLDPLSFTTDVEWSNKASAIVSAICPGHSSWHVENGRVILLKGDENELALRVALTKRSYTAEKLKKMENQLGTAYGTSGVTTFDTTGLAPADVAARLAEIIHLENYEPCDLHQRLENIKTNSTHATL